MRRLIWVFILLGTGHFGIYYFRREIQNDTHPLMELEIPSFITKVPQVSGPTEPEPPKESAPESQQVAQQEFRVFLDQTLDELVQIEDLQKLSEGERHHSAKVMLGSGEKLGAVAQKIESDPSLVPLALVFYQNCSLLETLPTSVRALCFSRHKKYSRKAGLEWDPEELQVPANVRKLAERLEGN